MGIKSREDPESIDVRSKESSRTSTPVKKQSSSKVARPAAKTVSRAKPEASVQQVESKPVEATKVVEKPVVQKQETAQAVPVQPAAILNPQGKKMTKAITLADQIASRTSLISRGTSSARANDISKRISTLLREAGNSFEEAWTVSVIGEEIGLSFPMVLFTYTEESADGNVKFTSAFPLMIEPEDFRLSPRIEKFDNVSYEVPVTMGDLYMSKEYSDIIEVYLRRSLELKERDRIIHAGALRIPASLDLTDSYVNEWAYQAVTNCVNAMDRHVKVHEEPPFTLVGRDYRNERLIGRVTVGNKATINEIGEPIRTDIIATVDSNRQNGGSLMMTDTNISTLAGYVEPIYRQPSSDPTRPHAPTLPQFVITRVTSGRNAADTESHLLAIVNGIQLINFRACWVEQLRPKSGKVQNVLADPGALGFLTPAAALVDSRDESFRTNFEAFIREVFEVNQGMVVAIDIEDAGVNQFDSELFKACAAGIPAAIATFTNAMDNLTGGHYSALKKQAGCEGSQPLVSNGTRIHAGYYVDPDRGLCDIRDVDLIAVCKAYGKQTSQIEAYIDSLAPTSGNAQTRQATRYTIIDDILGGRQRITNHYTRLYFAPGEIAFMTKACEMAKLIVQTQTAIYGLGNQQRMGGYDYQSLLSTGNNTSMFGGGVSPDSVGQRW